MRGDACACVMTSARAWRRVRVRGDVRGPDAALRTRGEAGAAEVEGADAAAVRVAMEALYDAAQCIDAVAPVSSRSRPRSRSHIRFRARTRTLARLCACAQ